MLKLPKRNLPWLQLRRLSTAIRQTVEDEGDWFYSSEWWGTTSGGGDTVFRSISDKGNGVVSVVAYPSSKPVQSFFLSLLSIEMLLFLLLDVNISSKNVIFNRKTVIGGKQRIGFKRGMKRCIQEMNRKGISGFLVTNGGIFTLMRRLVKAQLK